MGRIISLLSRLDAAVQRRFDSICFFLMRRFGFSKPYLRLCLWTLFASCLAMRNVLSAALGLQPAGTMVPTALIVFTAMFGMGLVFYRVDLMRASPGARSPFDLFAEPLGKALKIVSIPAVPILAAESWMSDAPLPYAAMRIASSFACLAWAYIAKTPSEPPPKEVREPASVLRHAAP